MKAEQKQTGKTDTVLWVLVLILVVFGLGALFSASEYNGRVRFHDSAYYFKKQLFATALGLLVMYLASKVDYRIPVKLAPGAYILSLFLSTAVLLFGQEINGSKRWLNLGPLSFQPSEFSKVAVILFLVWQISRTKSKTTGFWFMCRTMMTLLPVVGLVNRLAGGVLGMLMVLIIVWLVFLVITMLYTTGIGKSMIAMIQENEFLKTIYEYNPVLKLATSMKL